MLYIVETKNRPSTPPVRRPNRLLEPSGRPVKRALRRVIQTSLIRLSEDPSGRVPAIAAIGVRWSRYAHGYLRTVRLGRTPRPACPLRRQGLVHVRHLAGRGHRRSLGRGRAPVLSVEPAVVLGPAHRRDLPPGGGHRARFGRRVAARRAHVGPRRARAKARSGAAAYRGAVWRSIRGDREAAATAMPHLLRATVRLPIDVAIDGLKEALAVAGFTVLAEGALARAFAPERSTTPRRPHRLVVVAHRGLSRRALRYDPGNAVFLMACAWRRTRARV